MNGWKIISCAALAFTAAACGDDLGPDPQHDVPPRPESFADVQRENAMQSALTADEMLGVLAVASEASVQQSMMARARATDQLVVAFAERIIAVQPHNQRILEAALQRLGVTPAESLASSGARQRAQQIMMMLQAQGIDFDTAFLEAQIATHREVIQILDESQVCILDFAVNCAGFGASSFAGGLDATPLPTEFGERELFTSMRSSLVAQLTDSSLLQSMLLVPVGTPSP
jgi:predicted outer membrane protein